MGYRKDLWEVASVCHGVVTVAEAEEAGVPAVEVRKLASRGVLRRYGQGVYVHEEIPSSPLTQPAVAVALGGETAFLQRESVLDLLGLGQFNPRWIRVGTKRRVRRTLPEWVSLERRLDVSVDELTVHLGIPSTTVMRALFDMHGRIPGERWRTLVDEALRKDLIDFDQVDTLKKGVSL